jgi:indolepyruvate ferredoxin oxidoreductase alpha subunit
MAKTNASNQALLSGNEALVHGAYEAGSGVACAYPGTPSAEVFETPALFSDAAGGAPVADVLDSRRKLP